MRYKKYWLITYSQKGAAGNTMAANTVTKTHPAKWLLEAINRHPDAYTLLLYAIEISADQYIELDGVVG